ncbi:unnamed protein product [Lota lota]
MCAEPLRLHNNTPSHPPHQRHGDDRRAQSQDGSGPLSVSAPARPPPPPRGPPGSVHHAITVLTSGWTRCTVDMESVVMGIRLTSRSYRKNHGHTANTVSKLLDKSRKLSVT